MQKSNSTTARRASGTAGAEDVAEQVPTTFLQTVMDAFPHCVIVVDRRYQVVMANKAARELAPFGTLDSGCFKCYRFAHDRESPCRGTDEPCPLDKVVATKSPVRVYHAHRDNDGHCVYMAIDAAPIFNDSGEVVQIVESCRDVTERTLWRRILGIGNRHMEMQPLLDAFLAELKSYVDCEIVEIRLHGVVGGLRASSITCPCDEGAGLPALTEIDDRCICEHIARWRQEGKLQPTRSGGTVFFADLSEYLSAFEDVFSTLADQNGQTLCETLRECGCHSVAIVPIVFQGRELGSIHLADRRPNAITERVVASLEEMSMEMGGVIQRVHTEEQLRDARDQLESRVAERTAQLTAINQALQEEILERSRLEREILQISAREQQRIGQELHDEVGQSLTGLSYLAQSLYRRLRDQAHPETEKAETLTKEIPTILGQVRHIVKGLIPTELTAAGIRVALEVLVRNVEKQTGIPCTFRADPRATVPDDYCAVQFYRIAQEAINNAVKHARARHIAVQLAGNDQEARITVRDDGVGLPSCCEKASGSGLRIMRYRARAIGGRMEIRRVRDGGTLVQCAVRGKAHAERSKHAQQGDDKPCREEP